MTPIFPGPPPREAGRPQPRLNPASEGDAERISANSSDAWLICDAIGHCVRSGSDFHPCVEPVLAAALAIASADTGCVRVLDQESGTFKIVAQRGLDSSLLDLESFAAPRIDQASQCGLSLDGGGRTVVEDVALSDGVSMPGLASALLHAGIRAFQSTPLVSSGGNRLGFISTHSSHPHRPAPRQLRLLDLLARPFADYVERVEVERKSSLQSTMLTALLAHAPIGVCLADASLHIRHANPAALQIFGEGATMVGRSFKDLLHETWNREYADTILNKCRRILHTGEPCSIVEERASRAGHLEPEYYEWRLHRIELPEGDDGIVCYFRDISSRVRTQLKIHDQEERLRRVVKLAAAGQIASSLAHEINNPLSAVTNALYLLGEHLDLAPEAKGLVTAASAELGRVSRICKQTLSSYRSEAVFGELDLCALVDERLSSLQERFAASGIEVIKRTIATAHVAGIADEVRQAIDNLLANALDAMPAGGRLIVSLTRSRTWSNRKQPGIRMTVADTGVGIARENIRSIFDAFFTTQHERGRGLGLWVVRGIVGKHDGTLSIRSRQNNGRSGTIVSIVWPSMVSWRGVSRSARTDTAA